MLKYISLIVFIVGKICFLNCLSAWGQVDNKEIVIEKEKPIQLKPAAKGFEKISPITPKKDLQSVIYNFTEPKITVNTLNSTLRPPQVVNEKDKSEKEEIPEMQGLFKAGGGNYGSIFLEGDWQHRFNEQLQYGLQIRHLSAKNGPVAQDFSGWSENRLKAFGKYYLDKTVIQADLAYSRDLHRFYGYAIPSLENALKDTLKQIFNRYEINLQAYNKEAQDLSYQINLNTLFLRNNRDLGENQAGLKGWVNYLIADNLALNIAGEAFLMRALLKDTAYNRNFFQIKPTLKYRNTKLDVEAGLALAAVEDSLKFYPVLKAEYQLFSQLRPYLSLEGGMQRTSLSQFARQNFWLNNSLKLLHTNQLYEASGGIRGSVGGGISYDLGLAFSRFRNLPFFINLASDTAKFGIIYDEANILRFGGELAYEKPERFSLKVQSNVYNYDLKTNSVAFHRPTWLGNLRFVWLSISNLRLQVDWQIQGGIKTLHPISGLETKLSAINDLSFKADYSFLNNFSAFLSLNNVFATKYRRYLYYPNQSINFLIGLTYGFGK